MEIHSIHHIQLAMPEGQEQSARDFYEGILGITEVRKPDHLAKRGGVWFEVGSIKIHLGVDHDFVPARKAHPAFLVKNLQTLVMSLNNKGYETTKDQPLSGFDRIYVNDPFGNRIELMFEKNL